MNRCQFSYCIKIYSLVKLLNLNFCASGFKLSLKVVGFVLRNAFLEGLRSAFNKILSFLKAKACELANDLDNIEFGCAKALEDDVEFSLFLSSGSSGCAAGNASNSNRSSRYAELFFDCLNKFIYLKKRERLNLIYNVCDFSDAILYSPNINCFG